MFRYIKNFFRVDLTHSEDEMNSMIVRTQLVIGVILVANCYLNFKEGIDSLGYLDLISGGITILMYLFRKYIPLFISGLVIFLIIILLNYFIIEVMGPQTGNVFYFIVLPLGFSLIFQKYHSNFTLLLFILSGLAMWLSLMWNNPLISPIDVDPSALEKKYMINLTIAFILSGMFIYRYIRYYAESNERLLKENIEKKTLLTEIHHRVKNNLNIILGLIQIQRMDLSDDQKHDYLIHIERRIYAIAKVHEMLFIDENIQNHISIRSYIHELSEEIVKSVNATVKLNIDVDKNIDFSLDYSIPIGLIVNELIMNSVEHGFKENDKESSITIHMHQTENKVKLTYEDSGPAFDFERYKGKGVGLNLLETLAQQLYSTLNYNDGVYTFEWDMESNQL